LKKSDDIKVFISNRDSICDECKEELGRRAWITLEREKGALCLTCADLDHLIFLPSGDAALCVVNTDRELCTFCINASYSSLSAVARAQVGMIIRSIPSRKKQQAIVRWSRQK